MNNRIIIPVLGWGYDSYPEEFVEFLYGKNHISTYEFHAYRYIGITQDISSVLCQSCATNQFQRMKNLVSRRSKKLKYENDLDAISSNIYPYIDPDTYIFDLAETACKKRRLTDLNKLSRLSFAIRDIRTCQALGAPILLNQHEIEMLPDDITGEFTDARSQIYQARVRTANNLGILIPTDIPIDQYAEIVRNYRPELINILDQVTPENENFSANRLEQKIANINDEIERIKNLKRYSFLRSVVRSVTRNEALVRASVVGAALGWINPVLGCAGASGIVAAKLLRKRKLLDENPDAKKLGRQIVRDIKPYTDAALKIYLDSDDIPIRVLSMQEIVGNMRDTPSKAA